MMTFLPYNSILASQMQVLSQLFDFWNYRHTIKYSFLVLLDEFVNHVAYLVPDGMLVIQHVAMIQFRSNSLLDGSFCAFSANFCERASVLSPDYAGRR